MTLQKITETHQIDEDQNPAGGETHGLGIDIRMTIEDLAARANRAADMVADDLTAAFGHALDAGAALLEAQRLVPPGAWEEWVRSHWTRSPGTAKEYMRIAAHRDTLLAHGVDSIGAARRALAGLGLYRHRGGGGRAPLPEALVEEMRHLRKEGRTQTEIAALLGVSQGTVSMYTTPGRRDQHRAAMRAISKRRRAAARALERENTLGKGSFAKADLRICWDYLRPLRATLDAAIRARAGNSREELQAALAAVYKAEDALLRAAKADVT